MSETYARYVDRLKAAARCGARLGRNLDDLTEEWRASFQREHGAPPSAEAERKYRCSILAYRQALELLDQSRYH